MIFFGGKCKQELLTFTSRCGHFDALLSGVTDFHAGFHHFFTHRIKRVHFVGFAEARRHTVVREEEEHPV